jgi:hypothetical protein
LKLSGYFIQNKLQTRFSQLLEEVKQLTPQGKREETAEAICRETEPVLDPAQTNARQVACHFVA